MAFINLEGDFCEACAKDLTENGLTAYNAVSAAVDVRTEQRKVAKPAAKEESKAMEHVVDAL